MNAGERADALVADHWVVVDGVAQALREHEDLAREHLREIAAAVAA